MDFCMSLASQRMLNEIGKGGSSKNVVMSPVSISIILNMLASGSSGQTLKQFLDILGAQDTNTLNSKSSTMISLFAPSHERPHRRKAPLLNFVNALLVDNRYPLIPSYREIASTVYKTQVKNVDLVREAAQVKKEVNEWAAKETKGLIQQILPPQTQLLPPLCLANALYFKGDWEKPFSTSMTRPKGLFHLLNGKTTKVPFMTEHDESYWYGKFENFKLLKLPYERGQCANKQFSMYIFLPHENDGLQDLIEKFNSDPTLNIESMQFSLKYKELSKVWVPKMKFSYDFKPEELMKARGLTLPFDKMKGDFANMVDADPDNVFISTILHKTYIDVNEKGTEAAVITVGNMAPGAAPGGYPKPSFMADHPFMFMIVEDFSKLVLFTGAVVDPLLD